MCDQELIEKTAADPLRAIACFLFYSRNYSDFLSKFL